MYDAFVGEATFSRRRGGLRTGGLSHLHVGYGRSSSFGVLRFWERGVNFDPGSVYVWVWEADLSGGSELAVSWSVRM